VATSWEDFEAQVRAAAGERAAAGVAASNGRPSFSTRQLDRNQMRAPRWAYEGYIPLGTLTGLTGAGGVGKGTFMSLLIARLTKGELPGSFQGEPIPVLIVGDEDDLDETWAPRIVACGGDETLVHAIQYDDGRPLQLIRDIDRLDELVVETGARFIYLDQVLDHLGGDLSSYNPSDVRALLHPAKNLARKRDSAVLFTCHPNKLSGQRSTRDLTGGSGQFVDVARSALVLGFHPEREDMRCARKRKRKRRPGPAGARLPD
jgi:AAA domain